jgi:hypothetical protein
MGRDFPNTAPASSSSFAISPASAGSCRVAPLPGRGDLNARLLGRRCGPLSCSQPDRGPRYDDRTRAARFSHVWSVGGIRAQSDPRAHPSGPRSRASLELELVALRHQVTILRRQRPGQLRLFSADRLLWVWLYRAWPQVLNAMVLVKPATVVQWHRKGFRLYWRWRSRRLGYALTRGCVRTRVIGATGAFSASLRVRKMRKTLRMLIPSSSAASPLVLPASTKAKTWA